MEARPVLRNLLAFGRRVAPQARFLAGRLTPGGLGLELTTALAALAVGSYICIGYGILVSDTPGATPGDRTAADIVAEIRVGWLTTVAEVTTFFGSGPAVLVASLLAGVWLAVRRHWTELVVLAVGVLVILVGTDMFKDLVDRPRPAGGLVGSEGSAYPSGHAAHAVIYAWIALLISIRTRVGISSATGIVTAGIVIAAAIGLSRVYLGVHYLSDVNGGWAFGVAVFALLAALAVLFGHFRQDEAGEPDVPLHREDPAGPANDR